MEPGYFYNPLMVVYIAMSRYLGLTVLHKCSTDGPPRPRDESCLRASAGRCLWL